MPKLQNSKIPTGGKKTEGKEKEDVWDTIDKMSTGSNNQPTDENGFSQLSTNFYVSKIGKGEKLEKVEVIFVTENPHVIEIHTVSKEIKSKKGTFSIYPSFACQKSSQKTCILCDEAKTNSAIGAKKSGIFWGVIDTRGEKTKDGFSGEPYPKFFSMPKAVALQIKEIKSTLAETDTQLNSVVCLVYKTLDGNTHVELKTTPKRNAKGISQEIEVIDSIVEFDSSGYPISMESDIYTGALPNFVSLWSPLSDEELIAELA